MTSKRIDISQTVKLNESNFKRWKFQIKPVLEAPELWGVVSGNTPRPTTGTTLAANQAEWDKKDVEARAIIGPTLSES